jgi:cellulose synthase/poly-beta-1,6-N-acetylglucosamine synthase-like glycosyltransferase
MWMSFFNVVLVLGFFFTQLLYFLSLLIDAYIYIQPVNRVDMGIIPNLSEGEYPIIVLFYPVLHEPEETMRTTLYSLSRIDYPKERYRVVAIPNHDDLATVLSLQRLQKEFAFLKLLPVPATSHPSWQTVWDAWDSNDKAYWYHRGPRAGVRDLPPKKTRQLIFGFYHVAKHLRDDFLVNYIDADSAPPRDHFLAAAAGIGRGTYDVLQARNVAGNLLNTMASSWFAFDHLVWDANKYGHLTANGRHPYWVLGKGLFFKSRDLLELGGFHPWITIEDPEVGLRFWKNGKRLGLIDSPLIEEVPETFGRGITQRKRWVAGFFQSLDVPLRELGYTPAERLKAWLNFLPCLSLLLNPAGLPIGIWAIIAWSLNESCLPRWSIILAAVNITIFVVGLANVYVKAWRITKIVLPRSWKRLVYFLRVNPLFLFVFWVFWLIPLWIGWRMYRRDTGLVWERTLKLNAIERAVRARS